MKNSRLGTRVRIELLMDSGFVGIRIAALKIGLYCEGGGYAGRRVQFCNPFGHRARRNADL